MANPQPSRQQQVGAAARAATRDRLMDAAAGEFAELGYSQATVANIARRADVTVQTLYLAWGSKRALLRGAMERALGAPYSSELLESVAGLEPRETVAAIAKLFAAIAERSAGGWALYRQAAAVDAEIDADWSDLQARRRATFERLLASLPESALRPGLGRASAIDTAWTIASPDTHQLLVGRLGYSPQKFERWIDQTLAAALLG